MQHNITNNASGVSSYIQTYPIFSIGGRKRFEAQWNPNRATTLLVRPINDQMITKALYPTFGSATPEYSSQAYAVRRALELQAVV